MISLALKKCTLKRIIDDNIQTTIVIICATLFHVTFGEKVEHTTKELAGIELPATKPVEDVNSEILIYPQTALNI